MDRVSSIVIQIANLVCAISLYTYLPCVCALQASQYYNVGSDNLVEFYTAITLFNKIVTIDSPPQHILLKSYTKTF